MGTLLNLWCVISGKYDIKFFGYLPSCTALFSFSVANNKWYFSSQKQLYMNDLSLVDSCTALWGGKCPQDTKEQQTWVVLDHTETENAEWSALKSESVNVHCFKKTNPLIFGNNLCKCRLIFTILPKNFQILHGSVGTQLRWNGNLYYKYIDSFLGNLSAKEFWKLVFI